MCATQKHISGPQDVKTWAISFSMAFILFRVRGESLECLITRDQ